MDNKSVIVCIELWTRDADLRRPLHPFHSIAARIGINVCVYRRMTLLRTTGTYMATDHELVNQLSTIISSNSARHTNAL